MPTWWLGLSRCPAQSAGSTSLVVDAPACHRVPRSDKKGELLFWLLSAAVLFNQRKALASALVKLNVLVLPAIFGLNTPEGSPMALHSVPVPLAPPIQLPPPL